VTGRDSFPQATPAVVAVAQSVADLKFLLSSIPDWAPVLPEVVRFRVPPGAITVVPDPPLCPRTPTQADGG